MQSGNTALRAATALGDADCICELLKHGAKIDLETSRGTALLAASAQGDVDTLLLLLDRGASIDHETASGARMQLLVCASPIRSSTVGNA